MMKILIQAISALVFAIGFLSAFVTNSTSYIYWIHILVFSGSTISLALGIYWHFKLSKEKIPVDSKFAQNIESLLRSEIFWLQGIRPRFKLTNAKHWMAKSSMMLASENCATALIFFVFVFAIGMLYMLPIESKSAGVFGTLLDTKPGRGLATSFILYLLISSASTFSFGMFCRFSTEDSK